MTVDRLPHSVVRAALRVPKQAVRALAEGNHGDPHVVLGPHAVDLDGEPCFALRAWHPDAVSCWLIRPGHRARRAQRVAEGLFAVLLHGGARPSSYQWRFRFEDGQSWQVDDPFRFGPVLGELDLYLHGEGRHRRLWQALGARGATHEGVDGVAFAVWAPRARGVAVTGDFCGWHHRLYPMRRRGDSGVFELFVPGLRAGDQHHYRYIVQAADGRELIKADPLAAYADRPPATASRTFQSEHGWGDEGWMKRRAQADPRREPMAAYEVHLGSWRRRPDGGWLTWSELADALVAHCHAAGFGWVELLPVAEHPFFGSWGYQVTGYYAPTSRFGDPDGLRAFVDTLHQAGIGVILDWVPAHFPKDDFALGRFDGQPLYEHADPRKGEHPDWGTFVFDLGRTEVRGFLVANALYWLHEFHIDGLRVDAVASMLYLDYSRDEGQWLPNKHGGRENLEAVAFFRELNGCIAEEAPWAFTVAEESTAWPGVTASLEDGGLGFTFKWNMGWMHDTLAYFAEDPVHRSFHHDRLTFAMVYEHSERFVNALSHDEVVHLKRSLLGKMPGDPWQQRANLRLLLAYTFLRPGKVLLFMGAELGAPGEWDHESQLPWELLDQSEGAATLRFVAALNRLYQELPPLWASDPDPTGFQWVTCDDRAQSVLAWLRWHEGVCTLVVLNLTPVPRSDYRLGVPKPGAWRLRLDSDDLTYGGSDFAGGASKPRTIEASGGPCHEQPHSLTLSLPPLAALVLEPER